MKFCDKYRHITRREERRGGCLEAQTYYIQGLIQKERVHNNISADQIATQWWPDIITEELKHTLHLFFFSSVLCSQYVADFMKRLELCLMVVSVLLKTKFVSTQISVPKIGKPMSKTACINPRYCVIEKCFFANIILIKKFSVISVFVLLRQFFFK